MRIYRLESSVGQPIASRSGYATLLHRGPDGYLITERTFRELERQGAFRFKRRPATGPMEIADADWHSAASRLLRAWMAVVSEPLPEAVADEATLWLYARPHAQLEYMGRGRFLNKARMPVPEDKLIAFDIAGGRRAYVFRIVDAPVGQLDERAKRLEEGFQHRSSWMNDPSARLVLSIGGGGYRLFAALPVLKVIERQLGGDRSKVHEVWGSSGGALLGYAFANGFDLSVIDRLGYLLYQGKVTELPGIHLQSLAYYATRIVSDWARGRPGAPELGAWVEAVDRMQPASDRPKPPIPYYAMVSNTRWRHPVAFADPRYIREHCRDILIPCESREATAASMAVPFLFRPLRGLSGYEEDIWFDGSIVDENPVMLPFVKWMRDRKADPERTPKRLKIMLVNLNMRLSESVLLSSVTSIAPPLSSSLIRKAIDTFDLLLDSKTHALIHMLSEIDDVEILTATLTLGRLDFITKADIPLAIRTGQLMDGWRIDMFPER